MNLGDLVSAARRERPEPPPFVRAKIRASILRRLREGDGQRSWLGGRGWIRAHRTIALAGALMLIVGSVFATEWHRTRSQARVAPPVTTTESHSPSRVLSPLPPRVVDPPAPTERAVVDHQPSPRPAPRSTPQVTPPLELEMAALRAAREALGRKDARGALDALDSYDARFRAGTMKQEASALRIFALCESGDEAEARSLGRQFIRRWPHSPLAGRVESACGAHLAPSP